MLPLPTWNYLSFLVVNCVGARLLCFVSCAGLASKGLASKYPAGLKSEPELPDLMNEVAAEIPGRWRDVGLQLGVDQGVQLV